MDEARTPQDQDPAGRKARRTPRRARARAGLWLLLTLAFLAAGASFAALALTGKPLRLPVWAVAEAEARLNRALAGQGGTGLSLGGAVVVVDADWVPRVVLEDLRLLQPDGEALLTLPEARLAFDPHALAQGQVRVATLRLVGPRILLRRLPDGRLDLALGGGMPAMAFDGLAGLLDAADAAFAQPALSHLARVEAEALTLIYEDQRAGRTWDMGDGRLRLENRPDALAIETAVSLVAGGAAPAQAVATLVTDKRSPEARMTVTVDHVAAADIAAQAAPLAWLGLLDAPISGQFAGAFDRGGGLSALEATLAVDAGAIRPAGAEGAKPIAFDRAGLFFRFDPAQERIELRDIRVESPSLRLVASGHADLPGVSQGLPGTVLAQIRFAEVRIDPEGLFVEPAEFREGALDLRIALDPLAIDVGQLALVDPDRRRLTARGRIDAEPGGWRVAMDVALDEIGHDRLLALWPVALVPRTRDWVANNVQEGQLFDVKAALRVAPGADPRLSLVYEYAGAGVRFLRTLPPIVNGSGYATIEDQRYTLVIDRGQVVPEQGGPIDVSGSVFAVPDVTQRPATAEIALRAQGSLTATLALLDSEPFRFLSRAGRPVTLGEGAAVMRARLRVPLVQRVEMSAVDWTVEGRIRDLRSDVLVPGRVIAAPDLAVTGDPLGLRIAGAGTLDGVPFEAVYDQPLGPDAPPPTVAGRVDLSGDAVARLRLGLPAGMVTGQGRAAVQVDLPRGEPARLRLTSDLAGVGLAIPELGWRKPREGTGTLALTAELGAPAQVETLELEAAGLTASGAITLRPGGGLDRARFDRVRLGGWLDATVELAGRGAGVAPAVSLTSGTVDLRRMDLRRDAGGARGPGVPLTVALDRLRVSEGIALTGLRGTFSTAGGFSGRFAGRINGAAPVEGQVAPAAHGSMVRVTSADGGAVLSAAGIFPNARGGQLDMTLTPRAEGGYDGDATLAGVRIRNAPLLAELLSAVSVVGLLDQLNGSGILFTDADARFRLSARGVDIRRAAAVGASMGVSLQGVYLADSRELDMQGVISPLYLVNGIGAILTRRGEGLFGVNYRITGPTARPAVTVNPLSILTPGMFREIFRRPPPRIRSGGQPGG